jgi:hypothetical protein
MRQRFPHHTGFMLNRRHYLHIEEAAYLVDRSDLMLFIEVPVEQTGDGADQQQPQAMQRRLLSLQETFELMVRNPQSPRLAPCFPVRGKRKATMPAPRHAQTSCSCAPSPSLAGDVWGEHGEVHRVQLSVPYRVPADEVRLHLIIMLRLHAQPVAFPDATSPPAALCTTSPCSRQPALARTDARRHRCTRAHCLPHSLLYAELCSPAVPSGTLAAGF